MNFEAIPQYNKKYYGEQHQKNFGIFKNKHVLQKQKKCAREINSGIIKMFGTCQGKRIPLKT